MDICSTPKSPFLDIQFCFQSPCKRLRLPSFSNVSTNITFQPHKVTREERSRAVGRFDGFRGCTIWFTGLSGAGKTTLAFALERALIRIGVPAYGLDGDNVRHGLCKNLGFKNDDRTENIRRVAEVAKLFADSGTIVLASFISPFRSDRQEARRIHEAEGLNFIEAYVNTSIEVCESRDPRDLYKKARAGKIRGFTGIDSIYEPPENPDIVINAGRDSEVRCLWSILEFLYEQEILPQRALQQLYTIRPLFVYDERTKLGLMEKALTLPSIDLTLIDLQWLQVLSEGWATPLSGFMRERQYLQCLHFGQLFDQKHGFDYDVSNERHFSLVHSTNQSIPIVLPIDSAQKDQLYADGKLADKIYLRYEGKPIAILNNPEVYPHRKEERIHRQFGSIDPGHPTISMILQSGDFLVGGDLQVFNRITYEDGLDEYRKTPAELRKTFSDAECDAVFVFQLRNPIHNGHVLLMQHTRERLLQTYKNPMLLLHPLGGWTKDDDVPLAVRMEQHKAIIEDGVLDSKWTVLAIFPSPMLYAGPTEVQWHARARIACGANFYIVGRDPAGIQDPRTGGYLYDPTHGAKVLSMAPSLSNMHIIPFLVAAYDKTIGKMTFYDEDRKDDFVFISGTKMRNLARNGQTPPDGFMPTKAWKVLSTYYSTIFSTSK